MATSQGKKSALVSRIFLIYIYPVLYFKHGKIKPRG